MMASTRRRASAAVAGGHPAPEAGGAAQDDGATARHGDDWLADCDAGRRLSQPDLRDPIRPTRSSCALRPPSPPRALRAILAARAHAPACGRAVPSTAAFAEQSLEEARIKLRRPCNKCDSSTNTSSSRPALAPIAHARCSTAHFDGYFPRQGISLQKYGFATRFSQ